MKCFCDIIGSGPYRFKLCQYVSTCRIEKLVYRSPDTYQTKEEATDAAADYAEKHDIEILS